MKGYWAHELSRPKPTRLTYLDPRDLRVKRGRRAKFRWKCSLTKGEICANTKGEARATLKVILGGPITPGTKLQKVGA